MPDQEVCDSVNRLVVDVLHCTLSADHVTPTHDLPQGTPHQDDDYPDILTGEPWRWWG